MEREDLRALALELRAKDGVQVVVLAGESDGGGVAMVAAVRKESGFNAGELIADAAREVKGGGGRGDELAMAGGKEPAGIDPGLELVRAALARATGAHG